MDSVEIKNTGMNLERMIRRADTPLNGGWGVELAEEIEIVPVPYSGQEEAIKIIRRPICKFMMEMPA